MRTALLTLATALTLSLGIGPTSAAARSGPQLRVALLDASYERLPFGKDLEAVLTWARARLESAYGPRMKAALDDHERMGVRKELEAELARLRASLVPFDGRRSGFEAGLVAGQYVDGVGESLLVFSDGQQTHYLFFTEGKLYKVARVFAPVGTFAERVEALARDFGAAEVSEAVGGQQATPGSATWTGRAQRLTLTDLRRLYHGDLMTIEDRVLAKAVEERRAGRTPGPSKARIDPELEALLDDGDEDDE